jgi:hypothetical protein
MVTEFIQVQFLTVNKGESKARESLTHFQMRVLFGQMHQVKVLDCLESGKEDFDSDGESEDEEGGYDDSEYTGESDDEFYDESDVTSEVHIRSQGGKFPDAVTTQDDNSIGKYNILTK